MPNSTPISSHPPPSRQRTSAITLRPRIVKLQHEILRLAQSRSLGDLPEPQRLVQLLAQGRRDDPYARLVLVCSLHSPPRHHLADADASIVAVYRDGVES